MVDKLLWLVNDEASSVCLPRDDMAEAISFNLIQDSVKLQGEGNGDTSSSAVGFLFDVVLIRVVGVIVIVVNDEMAIVLLGSLAWLLWLPPALGAGLLLLVLIDRSRRAVEVTREGGDLLLSLGRSGLHAGKDVAKQALGQHRG